MCFGGSYKSCIRVPWCKFSPQMGEYRCSCLGLGASGMVVRPVEGLRFETWRGFRCSVGPFFI